MKDTESQFETLAMSTPCLVDERVGIIKLVKEALREAGDPDFFHYYALACNTGAFWKQQNFYRAGGASSIRAFAMAKAMGEAVERYCAACYEIDEFSLTSYSDADFDCVSPDIFALYS